VATKFTGTVGVAGVAGVRAGVAGATGALRGRVRVLIALRIVLFSVHFVRRANSSGGHTTDSD
jgi:hypothetical protein